MSNKIRHVKNTLDKIVFYFSKNMYLLLIPQKYFV